MNKYTPLQNYLVAQPADLVPMSFDQIERVIGARLPPKAPLHRAWWSNNPSNNVMTKAWLDAGFVAEQVQLGARKLVFRRTSSRPSPAAPPLAATGAVDWASLFGSLRGTVRIQADVTLPIGEEWDSARP